MIRICLVEDQTIVREGLRALLRLSADLSVVAEASDGEEAIEVIERERPDVVLLDLRMPRLDGVGVLRRLRERGTLPPSLILTTFGDDAMLFEAVRAGAKGMAPERRLARATDVQVDAPLAEVTTSVSSASCAR